MPTTTYKQTYNFERVKKEQSKKVKKKKNKNEMPFPPGASQCLIVDLPFR